MKILAIDPGSKEMGFYDGKTWWTETFKGIRAERLGQALKRLERIFAEAKPDVVVYEEQFHRGKDATKCLVGLAGITEAVAANSGSAVVYVSNQKIKSWTGAKTKEAAITWARTKVRPGTINEHEADAIAIYYYALENIEVG